MADKPIINPNFRLFRAAALLLDYPFKVTLAALNTVDKVLEPLKKVDFFNKTGGAMIAVTGGVFAALLSVFLPDPVKEKDKVKKVKVYDERGNESEVAQTNSGLLFAVLSPLIGHNGVQDNRNERVHGLWQLLTSARGVPSDRAAGHPYSLTAMDPYAVPPHHDGDVGDDSIEGYRGIYAIGPDSAPRSFMVDPDSEFTDWPHTRRELDRRAAAEAARREVA